MSHFPHDNGWVGNLLVVVVGSAAIIVLLIIGSNTGGITP